MDSQYDLPPPTKKLKKTTTKGGYKINKGGGVKLSTDPQSIAARERRHRISDRFKILQSLVPNGHKMDTVSMLEEAIHYVKFLKTQIWLHETMFNITSQVHDRHLSSTNISSQLGSFCSRPRSPSFGAAQPQYWPMDVVSPADSGSPDGETVSFVNSHAYVNL